jgi:hypothetical protein
MPMLEPPLLGFTKTGNFYLAGKLIHRHRYIAEQVDGISNSYTGHPGYCTVYRLLNVIAEVAASQLRIRNLQRVKVSPAIFRLHLVCHACQ